MKYADCYLWGKETLERRGIAEAAATASTPPRPGPHHGPRPVPADTPAAPSAAGAAASAAATPAEAGPAAPLGGEDKSKRGCEKSLSVQN